MKKAVVLFLTLAMSMLSLAQDKLHIKGTLKGLSENAKLTLISGDQEEAIKKNGEEFEIEIQLVEAPATVYLFVNDEQGAMNTRFFLGNETVVIQGSMDNFSQDIQAMNSVHDKLRYENYLANKPLRLEVNKLQQEMIERWQKGGDRDSLNYIYYNPIEPLGKVTKVLKKGDKIDYAFIEKHINTAYGRSMLRYAKNRFTKEELKHLLDLVDPKYKDTKGVKFVDALVRYKKLEIGDSFYDFTALDQEGKTVQFSDLFKGKPVLLDFSTMHCGTCQHAAPETAKLAEELKDQLTYVTYYIDNKDAMMEMYYGLKGNKGMMLWNKAGRLDIITAKYQDEGTPNYILFDAQGKVLYLQSGYSEVFDQEIKEWLK